MKLKTKTPAAGNPLCITAAPTHFSNFEKCDSVFIILYEIRIALERDCPYHPGEPLAEGRRRLRWSGRPAFDSPSIPFRFPFDSPSIPLRFLLDSPLDSPSIPPSIPCFGLASQPACWPARPGRPAGCSARPGRPAGRQLAGPAPGGPARPASPARRAGRPGQPGWLCQIIYLIFSYFIP